MNKVILIGRLTRDPFVRETPTGAKYARFTVAVDRPYGNNQTDFVPIVAWNQSATFVENYIEKGSLVSVEGRFISSTFQKPNNEMVTQYEVLCERIQALESRNVVQQRKKSTSSTTIEDNKNVEEQMEFVEDELKKDSDTADNDEVPWEMDL